MTSPFGATSSSAIFTEGLAFLTASFTAVFSLSLRVVGFAVGTFSTGNNPANASFSYESTLPFLLLSWRVTTRSPAWNFSSPVSVRVILPSGATVNVRSVVSLSYPCSVLVSCIPTPRTVTCKMSPFSTAVFGLIVTVLSFSLNTDVISTGFTSKTGTSISLRVLSA